jgi:hypothetical protein
MDDFKNVRRVRNFKRNRGRQNRTFRCVLRSKFYFYFLLNLLRQYLADKIVFE